MRPHRLILSGWGPYKEKIDIDFTDFDRRGLFLITGATGAGKTTVFDAITYALYGDLSGETREKNSVRSDFAGPDTLTCAELYFGHGEKEYFIKRNPEYLRPKKRSLGNTAFTKEKENAVLKLPDGNILEGTREVNAKMKEILSLDYAQFKQVTMIAQGEFTKLLLAKPQEKTKIFRDLFGTGIYDKFSQELRNRSNSLYAKVMEQRHRIEEDFKLISLTIPDNPNYADCIAGIEKEEKALKQESKKKEAAIEGLEKEEKELSVLLAQAEENNSRFAKRQELKLEQEKLMGQEAEVRLLEERLIRARKAAALDQEHFQYKQTEKQLLLLKEQIQTDEKTVHEGQKTQREKEGIYHNRESVAEYLDLRKELEENRVKEQKLQEQKQEAQQELEKYQEAFLQIQARKETAEAQYRQADKAYKQSVVGLAARLLVEGEPCPVCGSLEHPKKAPVAGHILSEEELEQMRLTVQDLQEAYQNQFAAAGQKQSDAEARRQEYETLFSQNRALEKRIREAGKKLEETSISRETMSKLAAMTVKEAKERLESDVKEYEVLSVQIEYKQKTIKEKKEEAKQEQKALLQAEKALENALHKYGFESLQALEEGRIAFEQQAVLEKRITQYRQQTASNESLLKQMDEVLKDKQPEETKALEERLRLLAKEKKEAAGCLQQQKIRLSEFKKARQSVRQKLSAMEELQKEYGYVKDLENMACGNNARKLVFEQFVLAGYFEEILRAANLRFAKMTSERYELSRINEVGDGRSKDYLEVQVFDFYTGRYRSVKTLSGGELFKASLCLALGLSDVIQAMHGGIRVEALFIDEGFGALDTQSLDQACEVLHSLTESNRLIGIISHVPQLRERIENQLVVEKTSSGSKVKIVVT